jgi:replicative DNA helicase
MSQQMSIPGNDKKYGRKSYTAVLDRGLKYIEKRMTGKVRSLRTPWDGLNRAGIAGLEWGSMMTIGARPGAGKTMLVSQILREAHRLNPDQIFNILEFQFEMGDEQYAARQFAGEVALDYGQVLSSYSALDKFAFEHMKRYREECEAMHRSGIYRDMISAPLSHEDIREAILDTYQEYGSNPMIVTIDHSWLIKKHRIDKDKFDTLYNTTEMLMQLKKEIPIIVLMITQLNRSIDDAARKIPSNIANYPTSSDIFGGDALMQGSDMVVVLNRPFKADIRSYGPYGYECKTDDIFMHLIKVRNGSDDNNLLFLKAEFTHQRMVETSAPAASRPEGSTYQRYSERQTRRNGSSPSTFTTADIGSNI